MNGREIATRAVLVTDRHSSSYVEDALLFAKWIIELREAGSEDRVRMLTELDQEWRPLAK